MNTAEYLLGLVRRKRVGREAFYWNFATYLPIAPTVEESLRIAMQNWDGESVDFYLAEIAPGREVNLVLTQGAPLFLEGLSEYSFAVHTDSDHRFKWRVTEISTGAAMCKPQPSADEAVAWVRDYLKRHGSRQVKGWIDQEHETRASFGHENVPPGEES